MINRLAQLEGDDPADGDWGQWEDDDNVTSNPSATGVINEEELFDELGVREIDQIREDVKTIQANYQRILTIERNYVKEVNQEAMTEMMREVEALVQKSVSKSKEVRAKLTALKDNNAKFEAGQAAHSTKVVWRNNQLRSLTRSSQQATCNVQSSADHFFSAVAKRAVRNYCIVAEVDENQKAEIERRAESDPFGMHEEISQKLESYGVSDATLDRIEELENQNKEIRKIGEAVKSLNEMFEQMAIMVYEQGSKLDEIAANVEQTRNHVSAAKIEIVKAEKYQTSARKKKLCIALLCIVILVILITTQIL